MSNLRVRLKSICAFACDTGVRSTRCVYFFAEHQHAPQESAALLSKRVCPCRWLSNFFWQAVLPLFWEAVSTVSTRLISFVRHWGSIWQLTRQPGTPCQSDSCLSSCVVSKGKGQPARQWMISFSSCRGPSGKSTRQNKKSSTNKTK